MWWTLTGNYGNILPIDWSKSMARRLHLPTLQLHDRQVRIIILGRKALMHSSREKDRRQSLHFLKFTFYGFLTINQASNSQEVDTLSEEDEAVASDLDLHALIAAQSHTEPMVQSAEEVIKEIDDLMQVMILKYKIKSLISITFFDRIHHHRK